MKELCAIVTFVTQVSGTFPALSDNYKTGGKKKPAKKLGALKALGKMATTALKGGKC